MRLRIFAFLLVFLLMPRAVRAAVLFSWDVENASSTHGASEGTNVNSGNSPFAEVNVWKSGDGTKVEYTQTVARNSWSLKLTYPVNEAGFELWPVKDAWSTGTIYLRWYEYFSDEWQYDFPRGLKIGRWFTDGNAYLSPKLWTATADCGNLDEWRRANFSIKQCDILFYVDELYGGTQYIQTGRWYKFEIWADLGTAVVGSADVKTAYCTGNQGSGNYGCDNGVGQSASADGTLKVWIDNALTLDISGDLAWRRTNDGVSDGTLWNDGWFGGNYSGSSCSGEPGETVYRYLDDFYVSSTLDRDSVPYVNIAVPDGNASEEGSDTGQFEISCDSCNNLSVSFTISGTATNGTDYTTISSPVTIVSDSTPKTITVTPLDDGAQESVETVILTLTDEAAYNLGSSTSGTVEIADNDLVPTSFNLVGGTLAGGTLGPVIAQSQTFYTVGPSGCDETTLQAVFTNNDLAPGDIVELRASSPGGTATYREQARFDADDEGDVSNQLIIRGRSGDTIIMSGANVVTFPTEEAANLWYGALAIDPKEVFFIETDTSISWGKEEAIKGDVNAEYDWWWDDPNDRLYVFSTSDPDTAYTSVEASVRDYGIYGGTGATDYITVQNLEVRFARLAGFQVESDDNWIIQDNTVHHNGEDSTAAGDGIFVEADNALIRRNSSYENGKHNIYIVTTGTDTAQGNIVEYNEVYNSYQNNIDIQLIGGGTHDNTDIRYNKSYTTSGYGGVASGIFIESNVEGNDITDCQIYGNIIYDTTLYGIHVGDNASPTIYNNTIVDVARVGDGAGLFVEDAEVVTIKNNSINDCDFANLLVADTTNKVIDYNIYEGATHMVRMDGTNYDTWAPYRAAYPAFDASGQNADPAYMDQANNNFRLSSSSPGRCAGADLGSYDLLHPHSSGVAHGVGNTPWLFDPDGYCWSIGAYGYYSKTLITN